MKAVSEYLDLFKEEARRQLPLESLRDVSKLRGCELTSISGGAEFRAVNFGNYPESLETRSFPFIVILGSCIAIRKFPQKDEKELVLN